MSLGLACVLLLLGFAPAVGQPPVPPLPPPEVWRAPGWVGEVTFLGANTLVGGLTAGLLQELRGGSFRDGFARGALGGAVTYGGRRLASERFFGAGLLGRQLSAGGLSIVRSAGEGRPTFSRVLIPVGPLSVYLRSGAGPALSARLDVYGAAWLLSAAVEDRLEVDWKTSISAGAPVFRSPAHRLQGENGPTTGQAVAGLVLLGGRLAEVRVEDILAHERVHVLQYDFGREVIGVPLEQWLGTKIPGAPLVQRFLDFGVAGPLLLGGASSVLDYRDRPWEIEAAFLDGRWKRR